MKSGSDLGAKWFEPKQIAKEASSREEGERANKKDNAFLGLLQVKRFPRKLLDSNDSSYTLRN